MTERLTFVVAGGGVAGTELVGEIQALTARAIASYPRLRREDLRWVLVEMAESILAGLGNRLARGRRKSSPAAAWRSGPPAP